MVQMARKRRGDDSCGAKGGNFSVCRSNSNSANLLHRRRALSQTATRFKRRNNLPSVSRSFPLCAVQSKSFSVKCNFRPTCLQLSSRPQDFAPYYPQSSLLHHKNCPFARVHPVCGAKAHDPPGSVRVGQVQAVQSEQRLANM